VLAYLWDARDLRGDRRQVRSVQLWTTMICFRPAAPRMSPVAAGQVTNCGL